jgi:hypothetical protein
MITKKELKKIMKYNQDTGYLTHIFERGGKGARIGDIAGYLNSQGYVVVNICGKIYRAHRLAFLYVAGYFPEHDIDHINGVRHDNRWCNLRHVTRSCNLQNMAISSKNTSGFPGVTSHGGKWRAQFSVDGVNRHLGVYDLKLDAALARLTAEANCYKWKCNHRGDLVKAIKTAWPEFKVRSIS